jgi:hypothetical protein
MNSGLFLPRGQIQIKTKNAFPAARHRPPAPARSFSTSPGSRRIQRGKARAHRSSVCHPLITTVKIQDYPQLHKYSNPSTSLLPLRWGINRLAQCKTFPSPERCSERWSVLSAATTRRIAVCQKTGYPDPRQHFCTQRLGSAASLAHARCPTALVGRNLWSDHVIP